ncbi:MAG TPA: phosphonatase-like hydrolase [Acidimicrobiales bacterium]|nr:phosphonatase-like hydrolase [Acidimicrobiales bacterium]
MSGPTIVPITIAVLDMAGTTVSDGGVVEDAFLAALASVGIGADHPRLADDLGYVRATMGRSKIEVFREVLGDEDAAQRANQAFEAAIDDAVRAGAVEPLPGAEAALGELRDHGLAVCLTTGFSAGTRDLIVAKLGWADLVDLVLAPEPGVRGRPHPDLVLTALMRLGHEDVRAVAVAGDTANDLLAGWRAGAGIVAGVLTGAHGREELTAAPHTHVLASVGELPGIVRAHS